MSYIQLTVLHFNTPLPQVWDLVDNYVVILLFHCLLYLSLQKKLAFAEKKNPGSYLKLINDTNGLFADGFAKFKVLRNKSAAVEYSIQDLIDHIVPLTINS